jgi:hypothetical protein
MSVINHYLPKLTSNLQHFIKFSINHIPYYLILWGIIVRLAQYLTNRSLWADEAVLALNIINRNYLKLTETLDYEQGAPIGFLWVEKFIVQLLGNNEYSLRLFPLIAGIISLFLFWQLAKKILPPFAVNIALTLFVTSPSLIYYSSELKQYSSDVATVLLLSLVLFPFIEINKFSQKQVIIFSLLGAIAIWFCHPAIFILAGIGISHLLINLYYNYHHVEKIKLDIGNLLIIASSWGISFILFYLLSLQNLTNNKTLNTSWQMKDTFPSSPIDIIWMFDALGKFFYNPLSFKKGMDGVAIAFFLIGCISLYRRNKRFFLYIISPFCMTIFASYLQKYPFGGRLVLFLIPYALLLIGEGFYFLWQFFNDLADKFLLKNQSDFDHQFYKNHGAKITGIILGLIILYQPLIKSINLFVKPELVSEIKPVISYVKQHQQPGDLIYVFQRGIYQFSYYASRYGYQPQDYINGVEDLDQYDGKKVSDQEKQRYMQDLNQLKGNQRVWILFAHAVIPDEIKFYNAYLNQMGLRIDEFKADGAFVYLYDFR